MSAPDTTLHLPEPHVAELDNGLRVLVFERRTLPLLTMRLVVRAGSAHDPEGEPGLSALTARLLRHGAGKRDAASFAEALDSLGAHVGAGVGLDHASIDLEATTATQDDALELFRSAIFEPRFDEAVVLRERDRAISEIIQARDEPDIVVDDAAAWFLLRGHGYAHPPGGTVASLARFDARRLRDWWSEAFTPKGGVLVAVGDIDGPAFVERLRDLVGSWHADAPARAGLPVAPRSSGRRVVLVDDPGQTQVQYRTGNVSVARGTEHWHALVVANAVLGGSFTSRLMQAVRVDRGLTYSIGSRVLAGRVPGPFFVSTFTRNESLAELHEVVTDELERYHASGPSEDEMQTMKRYLAGMQVRRLETPEALASAVAESVLHDLGLDSIARFRDDIDAVDAAAARAAIDAAIPRRDLLTVLCGDRAALEDTAAGFADDGAFEVVGKEFAEETAS